MGTGHFMLSVYPSIGATGRMSGETLAARTRLWTAGPSQKSLVRSMTELRRVYCFEFISLVTGVAGRYRDFLSELRRDPDRKAEF